MVNVELSRINAKINGRRRGPEHGGQRPTTTVEEHSPTASSPARDGIHRRRQRRGRRRGEGSCGGGRGGVARRRDRPASRGGSC